MLNKVISILITYKTSSNLLYLWIYLTIMIGFKILQNMTQDKDLYEIILRDGNFMLKLK